MQIVKGLFKTNVGHKNLYFIILEMAIIPSLFLLKNLIRSHVLSFASYIRGFTGIEAFTQKSTKILRYYPIDSQVEPPIPV